MKKLYSYNHLKDDDILNVDMTPLIDMVFILLIFFIVTTVFVQETGVEIKKPQATTAKSLDNQSLLIAITADGKIMAGGQRYSLNSIRSFVAYQMKKKKVPIVLLADKNSRSGILVDVIDECKLAGAVDINIASEQEK